MISKKNDYINKINQKALFANKQQYIYYGVQIGQRWEQTRRTRPKGKVEENADVTKTCPSQKQNKRNT